MDLAYIGTLALLIFGFGFVIFWHELGHFLAAKWAGVKVEQFAVGFGQAIVSWRKGLGWRRGSSIKELERLVDEHFAKQEATQLHLSDKPEYRTPERVDTAMRDMGIGETEYRLNWIPLGGYVKMLGQDDMDAAARSDSPRSYTNKPIGKRMVIVSAGVVMNIILAIILFAVLFRVGFNSPPPVIGIVLTGSPAQQAGLKVGDRIETIDGRKQHDFTKIGPNVALSEEGQPLRITFQGRPDVITVVPRRSDLDPNGFLTLGIGATRQLKAPDDKRLTDEEREELTDMPVKAGERIVAINGKEVGLKDYTALDRAVQDGRPVQVTVIDPKGNRSERTILPMFVQPFGSAPLNFAGMLPRTAIEGVQNGSSAKGKLEKGDVIQRIVVQPANDPVEHPSRQQLVKVLDDAGQHGSTVDVTVLRDGKEQTFTGLDPSMRLGEGRMGLGVSLWTDERNAVVADILPDSPAARAGITAGATIKSIDGQPVQSWWDVHRMLSAATTDKPVSVAVVNHGGQEATLSMSLTGDQIAEVRANHFWPKVILEDLYEPRQTNNPFVAAGWGITDTRDLMVQFYLTLKRMMQGSVPASGAMGPIGIFHHGAKIAHRGIDWVIWFLAMISANLAVVNFLPIPIVDGGLFVFLILEKIMGKPLSPRAQGIAQIVGLALIACVFLFVTYNDISRLF